MAGPTKGSSSPGVTTDAPTNSAQTEEQKAAAAEQAKVNEAAAKAAEEARNDEDNRVEGNDPEGTIITSGDKVSFSADTIGDQVVVKEDVYLKFYPTGCRRPSYSLLYAAGTVIPASALEKVKAEAAE